MNERAIVDLVPWLRAQLDEVEGVARQALDRRDEAWWWDKPDPDSAAEHLIALFRPERVLAEVEAKRRLLDEYDAALNRGRNHPGDLANAGALLTVIRVLKLIALPHADRSGYREEWRP